MSIDKVDRVEFQLHESELAQLLREMHAKQGFRYTLLRNIFAWIVLLPLCPFLGFMIEGDFLRREIVLGYAIMVCLGVYMVFRTHQVIQTVVLKWHQSMEARQYLQRTELQISPVEIRSSTGLSQGVYSWALVTGVEKRLECVLFWIGSTRAIMVPIRAFANPRQANSFVDLAEKYRREYSGARLVCPKCGYDLRGDSSHGCPECGWRRDSAPVN